MTLKLTSATLASLAAGTRLIMRPGKDRRFEPGRTYVVQERNFGGFGPANYVVDTFGDILVGIGKATVAGSALRYYDHLHSFDSFGPRKFEIGAPATDVVTDFRGQRIVIEQRGEGYTLDLQKDSVRNRPTHIGAYSNQADLIAGLKKLFEEGTE
jgi:hypothetical protein